MYATVPSGRVGLRELRVAAQTGEPEVEDLRLALAR